MAHIAVHIPDALPAAWVDALAEALPEHSWHRWPDVEGIEDKVEYAVVLIQEPGSLAIYPNLKAVFLATAGVDHILRDDALPRHVPYCRLIHPEMAARMSEYITLYVLQHHRKAAAYVEAQREGLWKPIRVQPAASDVSVGILGLGALGLDAARKLQTLGFTVKGWRRTTKSEEGVDCVHGPDQLKPFLGDCDFVVCCLPSTPETRGLIDAEVFAAMKPGAVFINVGRGAVACEDDLLAALDSGHVDAAVLDVFATEPLPPDHRFWTHSKVTVTPHISTTTQPRMLFGHVRDNIARMEQGETLLNVVDLDAGY